jgi:DNA-binding MurR/RpiR family transcriptional regulator
VSTPRGAAGPDPCRPVSVLIKVRGLLPNLQPAQRRVAEAVLVDPAGISESSITAVARRCQTSETTVLRFCRAIGLAGYPELRIALARAAQFEEADHRAGAPMTGDITATDPLGDVVAKIAHAAVRAVTDTATEWRSAPTTGRWRLCTARTRWSRRGTPPGCKPAVINCW